MGQQLHRMSSGRFLMRMRMRKEKTCDYYYYGDLFLSRFLPAFTASLSLLELPSLMLCRRVGGGQR